MASNDQSRDKLHGSGGKQASRSGPSAPDWAGGLRQLYDSVVEEPIPDTFKHLLDRLDDTGMTPADGDTSSAGDGKG
jgi:hypothetical protein